MYEVSLVPTNEITRVAGNTQIDVFRLLKANGEIDDTPEQQAQLMNKAKNIARGKMSAAWWADRTKWS